MGRCSFARGRGRGPVAISTTLSVLSILTFCGSCAAATGGATPAAASSSFSSAASSTSSTDVQAVSTLDLTGLQQQFANVADRVSPAVVAISASCTPIDSDDALRSESLNPQKLDSILSKTTRTVGTGFFIDPDGFIL